MIAVMVIVLLPGMHVRFESVRTRETLLEARRVREDALIIWGSARRDRYDVGLREGSVWITGTLWDRVGPALSFGDDAVRFHTRVTTDCDVLPDGYGGSWQRDRSAG